MIFALLRKEFNGAFKALAPLYGAVEPRIGHGNVKQAGLQMCIRDRVKGKKESHFGYEETCFLLLFGYLPKKAELEKFCNVVRHCYTIPDEFVEMNLLRLPGKNLMNKLQDAVLTLYNYDDDPDNIDVYQTLVKGCLLYTSRCV